jgi:hypothetical protein
MGFPAWEIGYVEKAGVTAAGGLAKGELRFE